MSDPTEVPRRRLAAQVNADPKSREELEAEHGADNVFDTRELAQHFVVVGFCAPFVVVRRKIDGVKGSLLFTHAPRFYFGFRPH